MIDITCASCGYEFQVPAGHPYPWLVPCERCVIVRELVESAAPPEPIAYHVYDFQWNYFLKAMFRAPLRSLSAWWTWRRYLMNKYGVEVQDYVVKLYPVSHLILSDEEVLP